MPLETLAIGFDNCVVAQRVVAVVRSDSNPVKRLIDAAEREGRLVDATSGRRTRAVIITDSNHVVLAHVSPHTLVSKLAGRASEDEADEPDGHA